MLAKVVRVFPRPSLSTELTLTTRGTHAGKLMPALLPALPVAATTGTPRLKSVKMAPSMPGSSAEQLPAKTFAEPKLKFTTNGFAVVPSVMISAKVSMTIMKSIPNCIGGWLLLTSKEKVWNAAILASGATPCNPGGKSEEARPAAIPATCVPWLHRRLSAAQFNTGAADPAKPPGLSPNLAPPVPC